MALDHQSVDPEEGVKQGYYSLALLNSFLFEYFQICYKFQFHLILLVFIL